MGVDAQDTGNSSFFYLIMGVYVPDEILKIDKLNMNERVVLSKYKYFTEKGEYKCCSLTCEQIADELNMSVWYLKKIKKHLKELGYIRTSGIKVFYVGINECTIVHSKDGINRSTIVHSKDVPEYTGGVPEYTQECTIVHTKSVPEYTHKNKEIKKEIKKEKKGVTNFDLLLEHLPSDYKTPDRIKYIEDKYKERINDIDLTDGIIDSWVINIKNELNRTFPIDFVIPKQEKKVDYIDVF